MAEILVLHASTARRIEEFNKAVSKLQLPYEGKVRKGTAPVFPYKVELWLYKTKKECVPQFLEFVQSNTTEVSGAVRPMQGLVNLATGGITYLVSARNFMRRINRWLHRRPADIHDNRLSVPDMKNVKRSPSVVPGWGYAKVFGVFGDHYNKNGEEEL